MALQFQPPSQNRRLISQTSMSLVLAHFSRLYVAKYRESLSEFVGSYSEFPSASVCLSKTELKCAYLFRFSRCIFTCISCRLHRLTPELSGFTSCTTLITSEATTLLQQLDQLLAQMLPPEKDALLCRFHHQASRRPRYGRRGAPTDE